MTATPGPATSKARNQALVRNRKWIIVPTVLAAVLSIAAKSITLTALTLARLIARHAKVVVVDLSTSSPRISVHLVSAGRPGSDRALLRSPRLTLAIDALLRDYDHVLLDAGTASDLSAELLTAQARAVVVPDASMADDARTLMCDQLKAVGFTEVTMLSKPSEPLNALEPGPRVAAA